MPRLTFPITGSLPGLNVVVGEAAPVMVRAASLGLPITRPVTVPGVVDSGTNITSVSGRVVRQLSLHPTRTAVTQTAGGSRTVNLLRVSLSIADPRRPGGPMLTDPDLEVMQLPSDPDDIDLLLGTDLLFRCVFTLDGPGGEMAFDF